MTVRRSLPRRDPPPDAAPADAVFDPTRVAVVLPLAVGTFLVLFSLVGIRRPGLDGLRDPRSPWLGFVDVRNEGNPHTWLNVVLLALAASGSAALAGSIGALAAPGRPWRSCWPCSRSTT